MRAERPDHTLQPTALVNELYMRLAGSESRFQNRAHFLAVAATAMRRMLIDHARVRRAGKRGGGLATVVVDDLDALPLAPEPDGIDLLALDDALVRLLALDERQGRIVELRFFGGLSIEETAAVVGVSERTVKREWQISRAWLRRELSRGAPPTTRAFNLRARGRLQAASSTTGRLRRPHDDWHRYGRGALAGGVRPFRRRYTTI